jgi:hypothetical protein
MACEIGDPCSGGSAYGPGQAHETPAALQFQQSSNVVFDGCTFQHIGSNAVGEYHLFFASPPNNITFNGSSKDY